MTCSASIAAPANSRMRRVPKTKKGAISSTKWLNATPTACSPVRHRMKVRGQRVGDRLGLEVIVEAGQVAPAGISAQLDEARAPHDPHRQPAEQPDHDDRRRPPRERSRVDERHQEDAEKAGLDQLDLPAEAVEGLADVHDRDLQRAQQRQHDRVGVSGDDDQPQRDAGPARRRDRRVAGCPPEERRQQPEALRA